VPGSISCINASGEQATQRSQVRVEVPLIQHINRNNIKRVLFVHRDAPVPDVPLSSAT
jgi:hypothetical protein